MMSSLYHNTNNNNTNNNQQQQHVNNNNNNNTGSSSGGRLLERDDEESVRVLLGGDEYPPPQQQHVHSHHQHQHQHHHHQQQQQFHQHHMSGPSSLSTDYEPFHNQQQQYSASNIHHQHQHQYHPYHHAGNQQHHHHQPQQQQQHPFASSNYSAAALPHTANLSLQNNLQNGYGDDRMFIDILSPFPNSATVTANMQHDHLYHQTAAASFEDFGPYQGGHPHHHHHHQQQHQQEQQHHTIYGHHDHFNEYDAGVMTMMDCGPPFTSSSPPHPSSSHIHFQNQQQQQQQQHLHNHHSHRHHHQLPPQPQPPPAAVIQQATTVASRRQTSARGSSQSRSRHASPPGSTPSSPGVGSSSASGAQVCGICKRDNVSFAKGYALTSENFAKYSVVFPHLVHTLEKGKICATCYNKCYAYHKKAKDETGSNHSSPSNSRSTSPTSAASSPSESFLSGAGRRMFQNLRVATANGSLLSHGISGTTSGNTSPTTPSSPVSSGGNGPKCIICSKAKTNQSKLVWLHCCKCSKSCHRKCYSNNKRLKRSLFGQWTCPDCKTCEFCGKTAEASGLQDGLNCCKVCDHSYCPSCQEGSLDSDDGWHCSNCSDSGASTSTVDVVSPLKRRRTTDDEEEDDFGVTGYFDFPKMAKSEHIPTHTPLFTGGTTTDAGAVVSSSRLNQGGIGSLTSPNDDEHTQITIFVKYMYQQADASKDKMKLEEDEESLPGASAEEEEIYSSFFFVTRSMSTQYDHVLDLVVSLFNIRDISRKYGPLKFSKLFLKQVDKQGKEERIELDQDVLKNIMDRDLIYCTLVPANSPASPLDISSNDNSNMFPQ